MMHPLAHKMYQSTIGAPREQYQDGLFRGAWRDAVYKRAYQLGVDPVGTRWTGIDYFHKDHKNPDWEMGFADGQADRELYDSTNKP